MRWRTITGLLLLGVLIVWLWGGVGIRGPWKAQVVDAETGQPLEGVVVLAWWTKNFWLIGLHGDIGGGDSQEVVTGKDGQFTIASRRLFTFNPLIALRGPEFAIFKSSYGEWHFQGYEREVVKKGLPYEERDTWINHKWGQFEGKGVIIELPPLKTQEGRRKFFGTIIRPDLPSERMNNLNIALENERAYLTQGR
jgi:hypothetical protein